MGFQTAKHVNVQFTFYLHVDLPLLYTTHLLDPIQPLSLNFTTPIFICKNTGIKTNYQLFERLIFNA